MFNVDCFSLMSVGEKRDMSSQRCCWNLIINNVELSSLKQLLCLVVSRNIYIFANVMTVIITYITIIYIL